MIERGRGAFLLWGHIEERGVELGRRSTRCISQQLGAFLFWAHRFVCARVRVSGICMFVCVSQILCVRESVVGFEASWEESTMRKVEYEESKLRGIKYEESGTVCRLT